uniref:OSJNBa0073E02.17 protein n=2 Tax=Oryza sativa TaxID=4530 RepID=Q7X7N1_ORYSJ|nr:OSJNBa0073E02.17 [Oryza sativa Japonica Group]CAE05622.1 OSJNBb0061C13.4 [Oryza sativa Japonica Group]CAH67231.1 OSIGBa0145M07.13 [Oryza sativa]CAH67322.1 OSIGBa0102I15.2 [Oryza sativa]
MAEGGGRGGAHRSARGCGFRRRTSMEEGRTGIRRRTSGCDTAELAPSPAGRPYELASSLAPLPSAALSPARRAPPPFFLPPVGRLDELVSSLAPLPWAALSPARRAPPPFFFPLVGRLDELAPSLSALASASLSAGAALASVALFAGTALPPAASRLTDVITRREAPPPLPRHQPPRPRGRGMEAVGSSHAHRRRRCWGRPLVGARCGDDREDGSEPRGEMG